MTRIINKLRKINTELNKVIINKLSPFGKPRCKVIKIIINIFKNITKKFLRKCGPTFGQF